MANQSTDPEQKLLGLLAQFDDPDSLLVAAAKLRKEGYTKTDAYTPFPIHGIDDVLGVKPTVLPWIVLAMGLVGGIGGLALQYWTNAVDYQFIISGKPLFSLPANIPVTFELVILFSAIAVFLGMLGLNQLPKFSNPLFRVPEFARATDDKFFLSVDATDPKFKPKKTRQLFEGFGGSAVIDVYDDPSSDQIPVVFKYGAIVVASLLLIPPIMLWRATTITSDRPRVHPVWDMDVQVRANTQTVSPVFADGRTMRPRVAGTVARGEWISPVILTGIAAEETEENVFFLQDEGEASEEQPSAPPAEGQPITENADQAEAPSAEEQPSEEQPSEEQPSEEQPSEEQPAEGQPAEGQPAEGQPAPGELAPDEPNWVKVAPIEVTRAVLERGRDRYNIYCAVCHGLAGDGDGLVAQRALDLGQATWIPPTNLHTDYLHTQPDGKLYNTITHGIRKMKGYGDQISPNDRWAIVTYVRALQKTRTGKPDEIPAGEMQKLEIQGR